MTASTKLLASLVLFGGVTIAAVGALGAAPADPVVAALPTGNVFITTDDNESTMLDGLELRTYGDIAFIVGREPKDAQHPKYPGARTWIRLNSIKVMVEGAK